MDGKVRPIPDDEDFAAPPPRRGGATSGAAGGDADLALAVRLQEEEIVQAAGTHAAQRRDRWGRLSPGCLWPLCLGMS